MKYFILISLVTTFILSCNTNKIGIERNNTTETSTIKNDTIRIANDKLEYEIFIYEQGFEAWLPQQPTMGYYSVNFLERKNRLLVQSYNNKVFNDLTRKLYEQEINYDPNLHYGLEVNYLLFNYFKFFQQKYKQKL